MEYKKITRLLMQWNKESNKRIMPWKGERDPYKVWLSEIILQQTRVEQGWAYYEKFVKKYPTVKDLAQAKDEDIFKMWEGLGYYSRCKNLLYTARFICKEYNGIFPNDYNKIEALKGVGPYTAAAIASFCFDLPYPVIDGNVFRVLARVSGNATPVDSAEGKTFFRQLADKLFDKKSPATYNQAIMDFGATVCKPMLPTCSACILNAVCMAFKKSIVNKLPVKEKILQKKQRWFSYFVFYANNKILVRKRTGKDIWQSLFEFYLIESIANPAWSNDTLEEILHSQLSLRKFKIEKVVHAKTQQLTHQHIKGYFITVKLEVIPGIFKGGINEWVDAEKIGTLAFPGFINQYLKSKKEQTTLF